MPKRVFPVLLSALLTLSTALTARGDTRDSEPPAIWHPSARVSATRFEAHIAAGSGSLLLNKDGSRLMISGFERHEDSARMWDVQRKKVIHTFDDGVDHKSFLAFTPKDSQVYVDSYVVDVFKKDGAVRRFNLSQYSIDYAVATNAKGTRLLGYQDYILKLWDLGTGRLMQSFGRVAISSSALMAVSADGSRVAVADEQRQVQVWDSSSGKRVQRFDSKLDGLETVSFSPDGSKLLLGGWVTPWWPVEAVVVKVWDLNRRAWMGEFKAPQGLTVKVAMSADGSRILAGLHERIYPGLWGILHGERATHERYWVLMWDTQTGARTTLVEKLQSISYSIPVAFSADGSSVAIELQDGVWVFKP